jgi:hypothetical protein
VPDKRTSVIVEPPRGGGPITFIFRSVMFVDSLEFYSDKLVIFFILYKIILPGGSSCQILVIFSFCGGSGEAYRNKILMNLQTSLTGK